MRPGLQVWFWSAAGTFTSSPFWSSGRMHVQRRASEIRLQACLKSTLGKVQLSLGWSGGCQLDRENYLFYNSDSNDLVVYGIKPDGNLILWGATYRTARKPVPILWPYTVQLQAYNKRRMCDMVFDRLAQVIMSPEKLVKFSTFEDVIYTKYHCMSGSSQKNWDL